MALPDRLQQPFLLPEALAKRLERVARDSGKTKQAFILAAVIAGIEAEEDKDRVRSTDRQRRKEAKESRRTEEPVGLGLGLGLGLRRAVPEVEAPIAPAAPQGQVIVNVGTSNGASGAKDAIEVLATYVANGPEYSRQSRLTMAVDSLRASCSEAEWPKIDEALGAAVAAKLKEQPTGVGGVMRTLRATFEGVKDFLP